MRDLKLNIFFDYNQDQVDQLKTRRKWLDIAKLMLDL